MDEHLLKMSKIYLIPTTLSDEELLTTLPDSVGMIIQRLQYFIVEERSTAERFLKKFHPSLEKLTFFELNEHTPPKDAEAFFNQHKSQDLGILSEAGVPCVADPGSEVVLLAHKNNMEVVPLVGPSSILLALMASGLNGQNFAFNSYLPKEREERRKRIKVLEDRSFREGQTQIFMEAPHHNQKTLEDVLAECDPRTLLSLAVDLTSQKQRIKTCTIQEWRKKSVDIHKKPTIFLLQRKVK